MWPGKSLLLKVYRVDSEGNITDPPEPVVGAEFTLTNIHSDGDEDDVQVWSGASDAQGLVAIPWSFSETAGGKTASFLPGSSYVLEQTASSGDAVRPKGTWTVTIGRDNSLTWTGTEPEEGVNRILGITASQVYLGETVDVLNDTRPTLTFDPNGSAESPAKLSGLGENVTRTYNVRFDAEETRHDYEIEEKNPTRPGYVFQNWLRVSEEQEDASANGDAVVPNEETPLTGDDTPLTGDDSILTDDDPDTFILGDTITLRRESNGDSNVTLKAQWEPVVCKITDSSNRLLYVNGNPAVYMTLKAAFEDFNNATFTLANGSRATPRKIKMLVPEYTMTEPVTLADRKIAILTTAGKDSDGYPYTGTAGTYCTIKRGFGDGSMITNKYNLNLTNITLDGMGESDDDAATSYEVAGRGGIVGVVNNGAVLTVGANAKLLNSKVTGDGGAVYAIANTTVNLNGGSIIDSSAYEGGAVYSLGTVNVYGTAVNNNSATLYGGGIYAGGTLRMTGGAIRNCKAVNGGGGIYATGSVEISGSTEIVHCSATGGMTTGDNPTRYGNGGAIFQNSGTLSISDGASIVDCSAYNYGGAIYNEGSSVTINGTTVDGHASLAAGTANAFSGGGIFMAAGTLSVTGNSRIEDCNAYGSGYGGAIYSAGASVTIDNSTVDGHMSLASGTTNGYSGGGIYMAAGTLNVTGESRIEDCSVGNYGGAIYSEGSSVTIDNSTVDGHDTFTAGTVNAASGGGIYMAAGTLSIGNGSRIEDCNANNYGGAIFSESTTVPTDGSIVSIAGSTIDGHATSTFTAANAASGGGIYMAAGTLAIGNGSRIADCNASNYGGAIYSAGSSVTIDSSTVDGHDTFAAETVNAASGGGIYMKTGTLSLSGNSGIVDCNATTYGGAIYNASTSVPENGSTVSLDGATITGHDTLSEGTENAESGGGIYLAAGTLNVTGTSSIVDCTVSNYGGAVYQGSDGTSDAYGFTLESGTISNNSAVLGGAVYVAAGKAFEMKGGEISSNRATGTNEMDGGAINVAGASARLYFSGSPVVYDNPSAQAGTQQKNVVLSVADTNVIQSKGITGSYDTAKIGVYVIDGLYMAHGIYDKPFGNFTVDGNLDVFRNDRNGSLYGVKKEDEKIYWLNVVCKLTNGSDALLYEDQYGYTPAVYKTVKEGFAATGKTLYYKDGSTYKTCTGALKLKMLQNYELDADEIITYSTARDLTFTTAENVLTATTLAAGDVYIYVPAAGATGDSLKKATLSRAQTQTTGSMFTVNTASHSFAVTDLIIDGDDTETTVDGGIFHVEAGELIVGSGAKLTKSKATNGGAVYVAANAVMTMTGGEITGCEAASGGAVYVKDGATMEMKDGSVTTDGATTTTSGTINGNTATTDDESVTPLGAGIYLEEGSTLNLSGSPSFGGTGRKTDDVDSQIITKDDDGNPIGNFTTGVALSDDALNGQKEYAKARQDIFLEGYADEEGHEGEKPATSIVVTGALDVNGGSIWVWAGDPAHYEMLKQFAVFESEAVKNALSNGKKLESTMQAFRNAWDDDSTGCGADYLTGQEGDDLTDGTTNWKCIYWTGGFDFVFRKIGPTGEALDGATFTLYMSNNDHTAILTEKDDDGNDVEVAYQQTDKVNGGKKDATATSGRGTQSDALAGTNEEHAVAIKVDNGTDKPDEKKVYGSGLAVFEKIPPGVYFMKEPTPNGIVEIDSEKYKPVEDMYMVDINGKGFYTIYVATLADDGTTTWVKDDDHKAPMETLSIGVDVPIALNVSSGSRKVVLRKVETASSTTNPYGYIKGAAFTVYYADKQTVVKLKHTTTDNEGNETTTVERLENLTSLNSGTYWMGELPCGTYYIKETDSAGYKMPTHYFVMEVTDSGVMTREIAESTADADLVPSDD